MDSINYNDLLVYYKRFKGNVDKIRECMMGPREKQDGRILQQAVEHEKVADCESAVTRKKHHRRIQMKYSRNVDSSSTCAVCRDAVAGLRRGAVVCDACDRFFSRFCGKNLKCKQKGSLSGNCIVDARSRTSCRSCRLAKCMEAGMRKSVPPVADLEARLMRIQAKHAKREDVRRKAPLELELISQRNHRTRLSYVTAVIRAVVRKSTSTEIGKLLVAVQSGDQDTDCVAFPHETITVSGLRNKGPSHLFILRAFRWNRINHTSVFSSNPCSVASGCICINPYHYDRVKTKNPLGKCCVVANCKIYENRPDGFSFHAVPNKRTDEQRYLYFFAACARKDLEATGFTENHRICSRHFLESDFVIKNGKKRLKKTSLPSQYLGRQICPASDYVERVRCTREESYERTSSDELHSSSYDAVGVGEAIEYDFWNELQSSGYEHVESHLEWRRIHRSDTAVGFGRIRTLGSMKVAVDTIFIYPTLSVTLAVDNQELPVEMVHSTIGQNTVTDGSMLRQLCDLDYSKISRHPSSTCSLPVEEHVG